MSTALSHQVFCFFCFVFRFPSWNDTPLLPTHRDLLPPSIHLLARLVLLSILALLRLRLACLNLYVVVRVSCGF
jgi:hypothetical protein